MSERVPISVYSEGPHAVGSVEQVGDNKWRASTRHALLGHFLGREGAIEPLHAAEGMTDAPFEPEPIYRQHGLGEVGRELKRRIAAGEDADMLALVLLEWAIEAGEAAIEWNRHLVEIPATFAVARWSRDADVAEIARCILGTLRYELHAANISPLREVLHRMVVAAIAERKSRR